MKVLIKMKCLVCGKTATVSGRYRGAVEPDPQSVEEEFEQVCEHSIYTGDDSHEVIEYRERDYD
jgi:hypothetical protein